jgi:hypothetical protein
MRISPTAIIGGAVRTVVWFRTRVLSTSRHPVQVFFVDAIFVLAATYAAAVVTRYGLQFPASRNYTPEQLLTFRSDATALMVFMSLVGGAAGFGGSLDYRRNGHKWERSLGRTIGWTIAAPMLLVLVLAAAAGQLADVHGFFTMLALLGPAVSAFGYRGLGFRSIEPGPSFLTWLRQQRRWLSAPGR